MLTINELRDDHGIDVKWTQNMITPGILRPTKKGNLWLFPEDEVSIAHALWQGRETLGTLPRDSYMGMANALRALFEEDERRKGLLYMTLEQASWEPLAPAMTARLT